MNKDTLSEIFDLLFPFKLKEDEFIEIDYDQGDKNFSRTRGRQLFKEGTPLRRGVEWKYERSKACGRTT